MTAAEVASRSSPPARKSQSHSPAHRRARSPRAVHGQPDPNASLPHRGAHDIGTVVGRSGGEVYVPRALWTETHDSPLKKRTIEFDPHQFAQDVLKDERRHISMRKLVGQELVKQVKHKANTQQEMLDSKQDLHKATVGDVHRVIRSYAVERTAVEENKRAMKSALEKMHSDAQRRERDNRDREMQEAAEVKLRTMKLLADEMEEQDRRKRAAQRDAAEAMKQLEAKKEKQRADHQHELAETRRLQQEDALRAEYQLIAQQERVKLTQQKQELGYKSFCDTVAPAEAQQRLNEERRIDLDVKKYQALSDLHYRRREAARDRQRQQVVEVLHKQVDDRNRSRAVVDMQKQVELEAVNESVQRSFEKDLKKFHGKRKEELQLQGELVEMMAKKQELAKSQGSKATPATSTMLVSRAMLADAKTRATLCREKAASSPDLSQCMDAPKHLMKPCGRPEMKSRVSAAPLAAAANPGQALPKTAMLASRDRQRAAPWHEGLTAAELKLGRHAAAKRSAQAIADKAEA